VSTPVHWREHVVCPVHYPLRGACSADCQAQREDYLKAAHALRVYWYQRRLGARPMSLAEYRARFEPRPMSAA
jgi:hypothetical protein